MSRSRLRRFLRLELPGIPLRRRPRARSIEERFGPDPEPRVEVLENETGPRPSMRCARCGAANGVLDTRCAGCGADLDRPEQLAFQERAAAEARERSARSDAHAAERRSLRERAWARPAEPGGADAPRDPAGLQPRAWRWVAGSLAALLAVGALASGSSGWRWAALAAAAAIAVALVLSRRGRSGA